MKLGSVNQVISTLIPLSTNLAPVHKRVNYSVFYLTRSFQRLLYLTAYIDGPSHQYYRECSRNHWRVHLLRSLPVQRSSISVARCRYYNWFLFYKHKTRRLINMVRLIPNLVLKILQYLKTNPTKNLWHQNNKYIKKNLDVECSGSFHKDIY